MITETELEFIKAIPLECFTAFFVVWLIVSMLIEKFTPPATGPITDAINKIGSCFTYAGVILAITALIVVLTAIANGQH